MQKKHFLIALVLGCAMLMQVGCSSYTYTSRSTKVNRRNVNASEQVADLTIDYQKKVTATSDLLKSSAQAKEQAMYQCIMNNNVDVVVDPIFQVERRGFKWYRATVTGFAGYYKVGKTDIDRLIEKGYTKEDIEKYLLLSDPDFAKNLYGKSSCGNVYNIKCETKNVKSSPAAQFDAPKKQPKAKKEKKQSVFKVLFGGGEE